MRRRFIKRPRRLSRGLGARLFISHFLVALVGALTTLTVTFILAPVVFGRLAGWPEGAAAFGRFFGPSLLYSLLLAGLAATAAAAVASLLVSRRVVGSLRYVVDATRRIASGRYGERVPVRDDDELGELSASFNAMARALDEAERRRMEVIYDLSHELRTPLSTLRGYTEGLARKV
jgi:signal transduction histidine kinase